MQTLSEIRQLLAGRGIKPKKRLGQHFLHDKNQIARLVNAAGVSPGDLILEVGPGTGTLTEALLDAGARIIACELDQALADLLEERLGNRIVLLRGDCLDKHRRINPMIVEAIGERPFKLVANLPYQIASPLMCALLTDHSNCVGQFATIQKEVADRLTARSGTKEYGPLTIIVQSLGEVRKIGAVSPSCFWPAPEVTSAMVSIFPSPRGKGVGGEGVPMSESSADRRRFARFVTDLFSKRRKQLGTIFGRDRTDWPAGITPAQRPEALSVDQHLSLWRALGSESSTRRSEATH